ncbi:hypothetical protein KSS87_008185 [Heliosperma pusillum]|nr:hypothetical protein KSS87_008185 [Heliosperma pusillum]
MTKNLVNPQKPPLMAEELDLDSLLRRHNAAINSTSSSSSSDDEDDRRRINDLLNNSDHNSDRDNDVVSVRTNSQTLISTSKSSNYDQLKYNLIQRLKSDEYSGYSSRKPSNSRPASVFSGGYRATGKPGAALAAAAAASRSVKSRRALSLSLVDKVSDNDGDGVFDVSDRVKSVFDEVVGKLSNGGGDGGSVVMDVCEDIVECSEGGDEDVSRSNSFIEIGNEVEETGQRSLSLVLEDGTLSKFEDVGTSNELDESEKKKSVFNELEDVRMSNDVDVSEKERSVFKGTEDVETSNDVDESENNESMMTTLGNVEKIDGDGDGDEHFGIEKDIESSSGSDDVRELVAELVEDKTGELESDSASMDEKVQAKKTPLEVAEELEKKQASTGQDWEEGAAAQPMRLEGARKGSTVLGYFDVNADNVISRAIKSQAFQRDYGRPQVLAVHLNYIALGMSKGVVIVVPSKYSVQHGDRMDPKMLMLGAQGDRSQVPVTSICFDQIGDLLLAGYGDGQVIVWNLPRATVAKVITGEHKAAVVHALFLGQDSQVNRQYKAITGDSKGLLLLHEISVLTLFGFQIKTQCLLDGQNTGTVLCASPLLPDQITGGASASLPGNTTGLTSGLGGVMGGVVGGATGWKLFAEGSSLSEDGVVIFATHQNALVVRLNPGLKVYAKILKPEGVREGAMPYTSWKCTTQSHGSSTENLSQEALEKISLLAIAWDRKVQVAKLVKSKLTFLGNWTLESAAIGLAWLDDQMLVILTLAGQLCLYARDGTLIHQTSYDINVTGGDDMIAYHTYFTNVYGNPEKAYQNSLAVRGASIYVLAPTHLVVSRLLLWRERIQVLRDAGDWMGAFNMAMTLYDGQAHGVIDLPRSLDAIQEILAPYLAELLISYVDEVFSYISVAFSNHNVEEEQADGATSVSNSSSSNITEQFTRVGGVAVEFCVHIKRTDILFDEIFPRFIAVHQRDTFLELLEPYILKDMLGSLPPEVMQALVEHYNCKGWLQRVEQCVLHMDISSLDFNQVVRLCRENGLYGALIYLFNKGLDDYKTPLEELLSVLKNHERDAAAVGYRMLVYLKYCFSGLAFPPGHGTISRQRLPSLRSELVQFLLEDFGRPKSQTGASVSFSGAYLNLYYLLELDTDATLDVLRIAFVEDDNLEHEKSFLHPPDVVVDDPTVNRVPENKNILVQKTVDGLVLVLDVNISQTVRSAGNNDTSMGLWPSKKDIGQLIEFIASYIATKRASVSKSVMSQILEYLMSENYVFLNSSEQMNESKKRREKKVLALLDAVPQTVWNASFVLHLSEKAQFYQVCGLIHSTRCDYLAALDSYMKDVDEPVYAFSFIDGMLLKLSETDSIAFRSAVISRIPELVILSREGTYFLVRSYFNKESIRILSELQSNPRSLFLYLKTLFEVHVSGTLNFASIYVDNVLDCPWDRQKKSEKSCLGAYLERVYEFPQFIRDNPVEVSDDMIELYLEMLCKYEPDSVLKFLEASESYRVDRCLQLCQEHGIVDAAAFLLERVGDVGSALLLVLSNLNDKFMMLDTAVGCLIPSKDEDKIGHIDHLPAASRLEEVQEVERILHACIGLCQRNTPRLESDEAESLWFHMLDTFCKPLLISQGNSEIGMFVQSSSFKKASEADEITWRICGSQRYAPLLKRLFSQFIKEIVEGMIGYVRLPSIMSKLLTDNGGQEFGDFKPTILGMLGTYSFEMRILDTAKCLIEDDTFYTMSTLRKGASKGYAPRSLLCCICNTSFSKSPSRSGIRMFSCGHAIHLQCELQESGTSTQSSSHVCPVCVIKKRSHKAKGKVVEQGLVSTSPYRPWRPQGAAILHSHELDAFENLTSSHPISRFEMLNSLQKKSATQTDTMPQLRLAPPAVYHDKVNKRNHFPGGSSEATEKQSKNRQLRDLKVKGSSLRFPLKSKIFGMFII